MNRPARRRAISWAANIYACSVLRLRTRGTTSGRRAWRTTAVRRAGLSETTSSGDGFQVENTWSSERLRLRIAEHPITFTERIAGDSKMTTDVAREAAVGREAALLILAWRWGEIRRAVLGHTGRPDRNGA